MQRRQEKAEEEVEERSDMRSSRCGLGLPSVAAASPTSRLVVKQRSPLEQSEDQGDKLPLIQDPAHVRAALVTGSSIGQGGGSDGSATSLTPFLRGS